MDKTKTAIYAHKLNNEIIYIGQSVNVKMRKYQHLYELRKHKHPNKHLQHIYNKYGESAIEYCVILEALDSAQQLTAREIHWLNTIKPKCNLSLPASLEHYMHSDETRSKIGEAQKGIKNHRYGRKMTEEERLARSIALKRYYSENPHHSKGKYGRKHTLEARAKMSEVSKGKKGTRNGAVHTEEAKLKISQAIKEHWRTKRGTQTI